MRRFWALLSREFRHLFLTPSLYVVGGVVTLLYSLVFYNHVTVTGEAVINPVAEIFAILSAFMVPVVTMRTFAGETSGGTIELLMTSPLRPWQIVASKFVACYAFYLATLLPCVVYVGVLIRYGDVDNGILCATFLGLVLVGLTLVSVGLLASALTDNLIVAAALGIILNGGLLLLSIPVIDNGASVYSFPGTISFWSHYKEVVSRGMIDSRSIMMLLTFPVGVLSIVWLMLRARGSLARARGKVDRRWSFIASLSAILALSLAVFGGYAMLDMAGKGSWLGFTSLYQSAPDTADAVLAAGPKDDLTLPRWAFPIAGVLILFSLIALRLSTRKGSGQVETRDSGMSGRDRWWEHAWPTALAGLSILIILVNINILGGLSFGEEREPVYRRWDVSEGKVNTLSASTQAALRELGDTLTITVFLSERLDYMGVDVPRRLRDLLTECVSFSPYVRTRYIDAMEDPEAARRASDELGLQISDPVELAKLVVFTYKDKRHVLPVDALCRQPSWEEQQVGMDKPQFRGELPLAIMIRRIQDTRVTKIYFTTGHGEMQIDKMDKMPGALGYYAAALRREGFEVHNHSLLGGGEIPFDCDVLVIAGPSKPFDKDTLAQLDAFATNGGRIFLLLPSTLRNPNHEDKNLDALLRSWGGQPRSDVVIDQRNNVNGQMNVRCLVMPNTQIAQGMEQMVVLIPGPRSFKMAEKSAREGGWLRVDYLIQSLQTSFRLYPQKRNIPPKPGPIVVAYTSTRPGDDKVAESRVVVVGGADLISNLFFGSDHNKLFALATTHWLSGRHYNVQIRQRDYAEYKVQLSRPLKRGLFWGVVVALPYGWLLIGALIWWLRKE